MPEKTTSQRLLHSAIVLGFAVAAVLILTWTEGTGKETFWSFVSKHFERQALEAITLACLLYLVHEVPWFRHFSVETVREVVDADFLARASDPTMLMKLTPAARSAIERALWEANYSPAELPETVKTLFTKLTEIRETTRLYRTHYREMLKYADGVGASDRYEVRSTKEFVFHNHGSAAVHHPFKVQAIVYSPVRDGSGHQKIEHPVVNENRQLVPVGERITEDLGEKTTIVRDYVVELPARSETRLTYSYQMEEAKTQPWVMSFNTPVHGYDLTVEHPAGILPNVYVFGVGGSKPNPLPLDAERGSTDQVHKWVYDGWMMPNQGLVVSFPRKPTKGKPPTPNEGTPSDQKQFTEPGPKGLLTDGKTEPDKPQQPCSEAVRE